MRERNGRMGARIKPKDQSEGVEHWRIRALGRFDARSLVLVLVRLKLVTTSHSMNWKWKKALRQAKLRKLRLVVHCPGATPGQWWLMEK